MKKSEMVIKISDYIEQMIERADKAQCVLDSVAKSCNSEDKKYHHENHKILRNILF